MLPGGNTTLLNNGNDRDEIRAKGLLRITALAEWMNSNEARPRPEMIAERINRFSKDYMMNVEDVKELLSDASMSIQKGVSAYDYLKGGKPSFSRKAGTYMKYLSNLKPEEYASVTREIGLSPEGQGMVLENKGTNRNISADERQAIIDKGKRPNFTEAEYQRGEFGKVF